MVLLTTTNCGRCKKETDNGNEEACWYCIGPLCGDCWEEFGHCGHPEADEANEKAKAAKSYEERRDVLVECGAISFKDFLDYTPPLESQGRVMMKVKEAELPEPEWDL